MTYDKARALVLVQLCEEAYVLANTGRCILPDGFSTPVAIRLNGARPLILRGDNLDIVGFTAEKDGETYLVWRGTQIDAGINFATEWVLDSLCFPMAQMPGRGRVHHGFHDFYACASPSLLLNLLQYPITNAKLNTGHSLGAAAATICHANLGGDLMTFACPRVGDSDFAHGLWDGPTVRVVNAPDIVPDIPPDQPPIWNFRHGGTEIRVQGPGSGQWHVAHSLEAYRIGITG